jgi:hypothetical protein
MTEMTILRDSFQMLALTSTKALTLMGRVNIMAMLCKLQFRAITIPLLISYQIVARMLMPPVLSPRHSLQLADMASLANRI